MRSPFGAWRGRMAILSGGVPPAPTPPVVVDSIVMLGYVHSLWDHNHGPSGEDNDLEVGTWLGRLAAHDGNTFAQKTDFGQHNTYVIPMVTPTPNPEESNFDAETWEGIAAANLTHIVFTPDNFNRASTAPADKPNNIDANRSNLEAVLDIVDAYGTNVGPAPTITIYNSFPKNDPYDASGFAQLKIDAFQTYRSYGYQLVADIKAARPSWTVSILGTEEVLVDTMDNTAASALIFSDWFEDTGPHGTADLYFVDAAIIYRMFYGSVPTDYVVPAQIHASIRNNWAAIAGYINSRVNTMNASPYPGPIAVTSTAGIGVKVAAAANGYGLDATFNSIGFPVDADDIEYSNDDGTTWQSTGLSAPDTVNIVYGSDGVALPPASAETIQFRAVNANGNGIVKEVTGTTGANQAPINTVAASISGAASGVEQTVDVGTWTGTGPITFAYQMLLDGEPVDGETSSTFTPLPEWAGQTLSYRLAGSNDFSTVVETAGVVVADAAALAAMDGNQSIHTFTAGHTSVNQFSLLFSGLTFAALPASQAFLLGVNDGSQNILVNVQTNGRIAANVLQDSGFKQSPFANKIVAGTAFDLRIEFDTTAGIEETTVDEEDGYTFAVYVNDVRWIEYSASTLPQNLTDLYLFANNLNESHPSCTVQGVDMIIDGTVAIDLNPASAALFNSNSDHDSRTFAHKGSFA